jgi:hypothetical protein
MAPRSYRVAKTKSASPESNPIPGFFLENRLTGLLVDQLIRCEEEYLF